MEIWQRQKIKNQPQNCALVPNHIRCCSFWESVRISDCGRTSFQLNWWIVLLLVCCCRFFFFWRNNLSGSSLAVKCIHVCSNRADLAVYYILFYFFHSFFFILWKPFIAAWWLFSLIVYIDIRLGTVHKKKPHSFNGEQAANIQTKIDFKYCRTEKNAKKMSKKINVKARLFSLKCKIQFNFRIDRAMFRFANAQNQIKHKFPVAFGSVQFTKNHFQRIKCVRREREKKRFLFCFVAFVSYRICELQSGWAKCIFRWYFISK